VRFQRSDAAVTCCSSSRNASSIPPRVSSSATAPAAERDGEQPPDAEPRQRPADLADPELGDVEVGVDPPQATIEVLADAEQAGELGPERPRERADRLPEGLDRQQPPAAAAPIPPGTYGPSRSASGRRENHRSSDSSSVSPAHSEQPASTSRGLTAPPAPDEDPLLLGAA
jgi:hypothetical protein